MAAVSTVTIDLDRDEIVVDGARIGLTFLRDLAAAKPGTIMVLEGRRNGVPWLSQWDPRKLRALADHAEAKENGEVG